jgi:hypothetical protein
VIANTELSDGNEEKVDSAGKPYIALQAANTFVSTRSESVCTFPSGNASRIASVKSAVSAAGIGGSPFVEV